MADSSCALCDGPNIVIHSKSYEYTTVHGGVRMIIENHKSTKCRDCNMIYITGQQARENEKNAQRVVYYPAIQWTS